MIIKVSTFLSVKMFISAGCKTSTKFLHFCQKKKRSKGHIIKNNPILCLFFYVKHLCNIPVYGKCLINKVYYYYYMIRKPVRVLSKTHLLCSLLELQINITNHILCGLVRQQNIVSWWALWGLISTAICSVARKPGFPSSSLWKYENFMLTRLFAF